MQHNYSKLPDRDIKEKATLASRELAKLKSQLADHFDLKVGNDTVQIPQIAYNFLMEMLFEVSKGNAITIVPLHAELSTQEASNYLNVSRPFLIKLLDSGEIPFRKVGTHRRIKADDLFAYKQKQEEKSSNALDKLADQAQKLDMGY